LNLLLKSKSKFYSIMNFFKNLVNFSHIPKFGILGRDRGGGIEGMPPTAETSIVESSTSSSTILAADAASASTTPATRSRGSLLGW
jgi:hypothetical protein